MAQAIINRSLAQEWPRSLCIFLVLPLALHLWDLIQKEASGAVYPTASDWPLVDADKTLPRASTCRDVTLHVQKPIFSIAF